MESSIIASVEGTALTPEFWDAFVRDYWGKKPVLFKNVFSKPVISADRLFEIAVVAAERQVTKDRFAPKRRRARFEFYGDGFNMQVLEDFQSLLPTRSDGNFAGYQARIEGQLGTRQWGIILNTIHPYATDLWLTVRGMLHSLFSRIGVPAGRVGIESFIGPYDSTPAGIHKDQAHVFTLPIIGEKITRLWPYPSMATHLGLGQSEQDLDRPCNSPFRSQAANDEPPLVLTAGPGDMTYWPASYWHIIDGQGDLNGAITVGLEPGVAPLELLSALLSRQSAFARRLVPEGGPEMQTASARHVALMGIAENCVERLQSKELSEQLLDELYKRDSMLMFDDFIEPLENVELNPNDTVEVDVRFPILTRTKDDRLACFINGHRVSLLRSSAMENLVALLNQGGANTVASLVERTLGWCAEDATELDASEVVQILTSFVALHALRRFVQPPSVPPSLEAPQK